MLGKVVLLGFFVESNVMGYGIRKPMGNLIRGKYYYWEVNGKYFYWDVYGKYYYWDKRNIIFGIMLNRSKGSALGEFRLLGNILVESINYKHYIYWELFL